MNFWVIKAKHIAILITIAVAVPVMYGYGVKTASVFNVDGREIPIYCVDRNDSKIAVTFDCAWNDNDIDAILETLKAYNCKATFFVVGDWAEKYPESLKKIYNDGHEIGNHSYSHKDYTKLNTDKLFEDMDKCDAVIENITGEKPKLVRAPSGGYNNTVIKACDERGTPCIQWSVDGIDYGDAAPDGIIKRATGITKSGDIILLHNGTEHTAEVLPQILEKLSSTYEFSTVSDMIYKEDFIIDHTGEQKINKKNKKIIRKLLTNST